MPSDMRTWIRPGLHVPERKEQHPLGMREDVGVRPASGLRAGRQHVGSVEGREVIRDPPVDWRTTTLSATDGISICTATQSSGMGVGLGVGSAVAAAVSSEVGRGLAVSTATGWLGSGIGGRLEPAGWSRFSWPAIMNPTPITARRSGTIMPGAGRRIALGV